MPTEWTSIAERHAADTREPAPQPADIDGEVWSVAARKDCSKKDSSLRHF